MEVLLGVSALALAGYLITREVDAEMPTKTPRKRVADYYVAGAAYDDPVSVIKKGMRLMELHIGSDQQDRPVVLGNSLRGTEAENKFEPVCVAILNQAFPSRDPFILSLVFHTDTTVTLNAVAKSLRETLHRHLVPPTPELAELPLDSLANKLILVSGPETRGSDLESLVTLSWGDSGLRRLDYARALHPREPEELRKFAAHNLVLVVSDKAKNVYAGDNEIIASGCQWNLAGSGAGFIERV
jgi:hypothetical protein